MNDGETAAKGPTLATSGASAPLGVQDATSRATMERRAQRVSIVNLSARCGLAVLLACIALVIAAGVSSSSRDDRVNAAYATFLMYRAQFDCASPHARNVASPSDRDCGPAADALVVAWRELRRGVPWYERAGAVLANAVGIRGFGVPASQSFVDEVDALVRGWPLARERAHLDP